MDIAQRLQGIIGWLVVASLLMAPGVKGLSEGRLMMKVQVPFTRWKPIIVTGESGRTLSMVLVGNGILLIGTGFAFIILQEDLILLGIPLWLVVNGLVVASAASIAKSQRADHPIIVEEDYEDDEDDEYEFE